jgi:hypothetical protein
MRWTVPASSPPERSAQLVGTWQKCSTQIGRGGVFSIIAGYGFLYYFDGGSSSTRPLPILIYKIHFIEGTSIRLPSYRSRVLRGLLVWLKFRFAGRSLFFPVVVSTNPTYCPAFRPVAVPSVPHDGISSDKSTEATDEVHDRECSSCFPTWTLSAM